VTDLRTFRGRTLTRVITDLKDRLGRAFGDIGPNDNTDDARRRSSPCRCWCSTPLERLRGRYAHGTLMLWYPAIVTVQRTGFGSESVSETLGSRVGFAGSASLPEGVAAVAIGGSIAASGTGNPSAILVARRFICTALPVSAVG
jgi:hypothetical protein